MAGLHRREGKCKYLVMRRDGTVPDWEWFVLGARDKWAPAGLRAYAKEAGRDGADLQYVTDILDMAVRFEVFQELAGLGDPDAKLHRTDHPWVSGILYMYARSHSVMVMPPPPIVVGIDCERMHKVAVEALGLQGQEASQWMQDRFDEVVQFVSELNADENIITGIGQIVSIEPPINAVQAGDHFVYDSSKEVQN